MYYPGHANRPGGSRERILAGRNDLFYDAYGRFTEPVMDSVRKETFGKDIGQNSWLTVDEFDRFLAWLDLAPDHHFLEVASGSGGPALHAAQAAGCRVTGIDAHEAGVATATQGAVRASLAHRAVFRVADANARLPFEDGAFDAVICIDAMNHLPDRRGVLREWNRVLRPGRRALFTDPVVLTGPVTNEELARRSSIGLFVFVPPGFNEELIAAAGLSLLRREDVTENAARVSGRWLEARRRHRAALLPIEGEERFEGVQEFLATVERLTRERRLSRIVYLAEKPAR